MNNQLRQKCIEAGAEAGARAFGWPNVTTEDRVRAEATLDAMLDVLADNADQFKPATFQLCVEDVVRVLRNGRTDG
jgi:hypothetical protein